MNNNRGLRSLLAVNVLAGSASGVMLLVLPLYTLWLNASPAEMGLIGGMAGAGRMLIIVPSGVWVDRYGTRPLFVGSTLLCVLLTAAIPWIRNPLPLMAVLFFQGMTQSIGFMTLQASFLTILRHLNASQAGWQRSATQFGFYLIGPLAGALLISGDRYAPAFLAVSALFLAGVAVTLYAGDAETTGPRQQPPSATLGDDFRQTLSLLGDNDLRCALGIEFLGAAVFMMYRTFMGPVALDVLKLSTHAVFWLVTTQGTAAMCLLFWGGGLVRNRSTVWTFTAASFLVIAGNALLALANGFAVAWLGGLIYGAGTGLLSYASLIRLSKVPGEKGKIAALFSLSIAVGNTVGPVCAGYTGELIGLRGAFLVPVALMLASLAGLALWLRRPQRVEDTFPLEVSGEEN
ncbi:MFS transporter [Geomesophilobacter sediminis]|uniref:MFS transporter n=1 Tax=Geomesophilobacter sediminis TaxID=2798584 RepID=A0A8J7IPJ5_9BACT|nr:MFS transporter [Geomesophilobacter sediminis]MBJ6724324.1 MFS transporter [Geomesophilobacter sediminis]